MTVKILGIDHADQRGTIRDLLRNTSITDVTLLTCAAGSERGHHYHTVATVYVYVLSGHMVVHTREEKREVVAGDLITFPPFDLHVLKAVSESTFLLMASGPRGGELTVAERLP